MSEFKISLLPYVERLKKAADKDEEVERILKEINELYFDSTERHLSKNDQIRLLDRFQTYFRERPNESRTPPTFQYTKWYSREVLSFTENKGILDALDKAKGNLGR